MSFDLSALGGVVAAAAVLFLFSWSRLRYDHGIKTIHGKSSRIPPSPPTETILGHRLPTKYPFLTIASWIEQYGPVISLRAGTNRYVIIGRHQAAMDIMEKHGSALVDRPRSVAASELLARGLRLILTSGGERLKRMRRALHVHLQPRVAKTYESLQMSYAKEAVLGLLESPEQYHQHAHSSSASVILKLTYGKNIPTHASDPDVLLVRKSLARLGRSLSPGAYLVDSFPWLKYLPWYARDLRQGFFEDRALFHRQLDAVKRQMNDPVSGPSFGKSLLAREIDFGLDETEMAFLAGAMFSAGVDTTAIAFCNAMTAAARHPDAQAAVHAELNAVVGNDRLPTFEDEESLPILQAFITESMRWRPVVPPGFAHRASEDIIWGDYYIPAGTAVFGNHWAISRDPDVFPDPDTFNLKRWLTCEGNLRDDLKFPAFGFGRRVCPGQHVANKSLFIDIVLALWAFHVSVDESRPADDMGFMQGGMSDVAPIGLHFKPRVARERLKLMVEQSIGHEDFSTSSDHSGRSK